MKSSDRLKNAVQKLPGSQRLGVEARRNVRKARVRVEKARRSLDDFLLENSKLAEVNLKLKDKLQKIEKDKELATALAFQVLARAKDIRKNLPGQFLKKIKPKRTPSQVDE